MTSLSVRSILPILQEFGARGTSLGNDSGRVIYVIAEVAGGAIVGPVKIGYTKKLPAQRLKAIQACSPRPLTIVAILRGATLRLERRLHGALQEHRLHGEWFELAGGVQRFLDCLASLTEGEPNG